LLLLLVAGGIMAWSRELGDGTLNAAPRRLLHETNWGYVPVVGSLDQMINGRNFLSQAAGGAFFILDATLVGPLVKLAAKGVFFPLKVGLRSGLELLKRGGGSAAQKTALQKALLGSGHNSVRLMSEQAANELARSLTRNGTHLLVGTEGALNHSVIWVIREGMLYKLHGGVLRFAAKTYGTEAGKTVTGNWLRSTFNTMSWYSTESFSDDVLKTVIKYWEAQGQNGALQSLCRAGGCAYSQAYLMNELGLQGLKSTRFGLPILLEQGRMAGRAGTHYLINSSRVLSGTLSAGLTKGAGLATGKAAAGVTRMELNRAFLAVPQEELSFTNSPSVFPGMSSDQVDIYLPDTAKNKRSNWSRGGARKPRDGGSKREQRTAGFR
jgi:hypothetical protein